ncbi:ABC transporter permease [Chitinolyticbacter albus]|uniref:ABC transporter permease n=1 Tax=Chitinolyticbacter albus TaxID=2961951 RepID=UPI0035709608
MQDVKTRFQRSLLGPLWIFLNLGLMMLAIGLIFGRLFHQPMAEFLPFLSLGLVIWGTIGASLGEGAITFVGAEGYIKQFPFPKAVYIFRALVSMHVVFLTGLIIYFFVALSYGKFNLLGIVFSLPGVLFFVLTNFAHVVICAHLGAKFRDVPHMISAAFQVLFYVTPVMYTVEMLKSRHLDFIYLFNPFYYMIEIIRRPMLQGVMPGWDVYLPALGYAVFVLAFAAFIVKKLSNRIVYVL